MGSSKSKNKKKKSESKKGAGKSDSQKSDPSEAKVKEAKPVAESPKPSKQPEGEGPCNKGKPSHCLQFHFEFLISKKQIFVLQKYRVTPASITPSNWNYWSLSTNASPDF